MNKTFKRGGFILFLLYLILLVMSNPTPNVLQINIHLIWNRHYKWHFCNPELCYSLP